jgi:hypothetical protein
MSTKTKKTKKVFKLVTKETFWWYNFSDFDKCYELLQTPFHKLSYRGYDSKYEAIKALEKLIESDPELYQNHIFNGVLVSQITSQVKEIEHAV